jgi:hypothetical protein
VPKKLIKISSKSEEIIFLGIKILKLKQNDVYIIMWVRTICGDWIGNCICSTLADRKYK